MKLSGLDDKPSIKARALLLGERIDLRSLETTNRLAVSPIVISAGERGAATLFRYGAAVLFDLSPMEEASFLTQLRPLISDPLERPESESVELRIDPSGEEWVENNVIVLQSATTERLQIVAGILAKSVALAHYEATVAEVFDQIEPLAAGLQQKAWMRQRAHELLRHIGGTLLIQQQMVGRVEVVDKPELLWERPELERLYVRLEKEYELRERHLALERKLELIYRTADTLLSLLQDARSLRVEWYIVLLIVFEIMLTLYEMIVGRA